MAKISYTQCDEILKTLPVGFYLGHGLIVMLDPTGEETFVNRLTEEITISYPMIAEALDEYPTDMTPAEQESVVRGLLYHEISHLLLTPKLTEVCFRQCKKYCADRGINKDYFHYIYNVIEDERIETILKKHFLNVDFEKNKKLLLADTDLTKSDPLARFFRATRLHIGSHDALCAIAGLIRDYAKITATSEWYYSTPNIDTYVQAILDVFKKYFLETAEETPEPDTPGDKGDSGESGEGTPTDHAQPTDDSETATASSHSDTPDDSPFDDIEEDVKKEIAELLEIDDPDEALETLAAALVKALVTETCVNSKIAEQRPRIQRIITNALNRRNNHSSSSSAYAGHLDPRLCMNKDYRWWIKQNNGSAGNKFSKLKINLFVDTSGSFCRSEDAINALIKVLLELESRDFELDVISMNDNNMLRPKATRWVRIHGGNDLTRDDIHGIYKRVQTPNARVYNIAVFDGWAFTDTPHDRRSSASYRKAFSVFNHPNCIVVSDSDNEDVIEKACPEARKKIISGCYAETFIDEVLTLLDRLIA